MSIVQSTVNDVEMDSIAIIRSESPSLSSSSSSRSQEDVQDVGEYPEGGWRAYGVVLGSFLGLTVNFGTLNAIGAIQTYIGTHQLAHVSTSTVSWIFSIYLALSFAVGILAGPLFDMHGPFVLLVCGTLLQLGGFMAVANSSTVWQFILSFSVCVGLGNAFCITPLIGAVSHWFLIKRGRATAVATVGGSIGGIFIPLMLRSLYVKVGFPWAIRILGFISFGCMSCSILLVKERISRKVVYDDKYSGKVDKIIAAGKNLVDLKALKDMKYMFCMLGVFFIELSLMSMTTYYASYAIRQGVNESTSYILLTILNSTGVLGRLVSGYFSDFMGHFNVMILMLSGMSIAMFLLWLPFGSHVPVLYAFAAIVGFFSASFFSLMPVCLGAITPVHLFGQRYGLLYFFVSVGNLFGIPLGALIIGEGSIHQYKMFSMFCAITSAFGLICWFISRYHIVGFKLNVKI
ncbi:monocarboxylate transporter [Scheffersomyces xylosifermentans]|uniref:monocarboxylate transporter n=1 Tax=Scheffersomyces xylosifermentans TaxID=1304137 RepID=UPI00315C8991